MTAPKPTTDERERRAVAVGLELRAAAEGETGRTTHGYAALFNTETNIGGYWTETIAPGAFGKSLRGHDVLALHSHDTGRVVGRLKAGTLSLREDDKGLFFENQLPDTSDGRDLLVQIGRGDIAGMSFGFVSTRSEWNETVDPPHRTIIEARLYEITYTPMPQYDDTSVGLRSLDLARNERRSHNKAGARSRIAARRAKLAQTERRI
jgi:HK97 family phage prohead protease